MTSILKVDTIQDQAGNNIINESGDTITIGASGDTITIPSGATLSNLGTATGFGKILQVVQGTSSTAFTQSSASNSTTYYPSSNKLTASITPSSTSSKIIINAIATVRADKDAGGSGDLGVALVVKEIISGGSTTELYPTPNAYNAGMYIGINDASQVIRFRHNEIIYRTPSTTSAITYEVGVFGYGSALSTLFLNGDSTRGEIILYEVQG